MLTLRTCFVIMAVSLTGCGGSSEPEPAPGPIAFYGHPEGELGDGFNNILVMNPDGTGVRRLTRTDGDVAPSWSPDGTQVGFERVPERCGRDDACAQIWIVEADGSRERRLTPASERSEAPDWSPDGDRIAFHRWDADAINIYVMNVDGSDVRQLTDGGTNENPMWLSDGERIAFRKEVDDGSAITYEMRTMDVEGNELTDTPFDVDWWSVDGDKIAFVRQRTIVVMNEDGSEERTIFSRGPDPLLWIHSLGWSPDSSQIAFVVYNDRVGEGGEVWVTDADGGNAHKLPVGPYSEPYGLDWAPARD
jgi:TolB protein